MLEILHIEWWIVDVKRFFYLFIVYKTTIRKNQVNKLKQKKIIWVVSFCDCVFRQHWNYYSVFIKRLLEEKNQVNNKKTKQKTLLFLHPIWYGEKLKTKSFALLFYMFLSRKLRSKMKFGLQKFISCSILQVKKVRKINFLVKIFV